MMRFYTKGCLAGAALLAAVSAVRAQNAPVVIHVNAASGQHAISPLIYGVCFASKDQLTKLNSPVNRYGGNSATGYNWKNNSTNHANDWYFESIAEKSAEPGASVDSFIAGSKSGGAAPMVTLTTIGWVSKVGPNRQTIPSFSVKKYGAQEKTDPYNTDAGNGMKPDGKTPIAGNDPNDSYVPSDPEYQAAFVRHLIGKWGSASTGGVHWYIMDNEPSIWNSTHRDMHPQGETMDEILKDVLSYGSMVKKLDPGAKVAAPEEWGWPGYFTSGADQKYASLHNWQGSPDKDAHQGQDVYPWLLSQIHKHDQKTGVRTLDMLTAHIYPQGGDGGDDVSPKIVDLRNRSTRSLWDPNYKDESWINKNVVLIPRLKGWVAQNYPGTKIGITEYNWGAEKNISGATAQADLLGIFGREGLDLATRWTCPDTATPTFKAIQMYRNYDGRDSTFGSISVSDTVPNPDAVSSFASIRQRDHSLTIMVINKSQSGPTPVMLAVSNFPGRTAQVWQLTSSNTISKLPNTNVSKGSLSAELPAQSITLFVVSKD
jgi:hypothetical protein